MFCASTTRLEDWVLGLETVQQLSHCDTLAVQRLSRNVEELSIKFREYHYAVVDPTEHEDTLAEEQATMHD